MMLNRKKQANDIEIDLPLRELGEAHVSLWNVLRGESKSEVFNASGVMLDDHSALMKTQCDDRCYVVAVQIGSRLYEVATVAASSPEVRRLADQMVEFGPTPKEAERERLRKARQKMTPEEAEAEEVKLREAWGLDVYQPGEDVGIPVHSSNYRRVPIA